MKKYYQITYFVIGIFLGTLVWLPGCKKGHKKQENPIGIPIQKKQKRIYNPRKKRQATYEQAFRNYAPVLPLIQTIELPTSKQKLQEHIMLHNDQYNKQKNNVLLSAPYHDVPFIQYKWILEKRIRVLKHYSKKLTAKTDSYNTTLEQNIQNLIAQLEQLNEIIVTSQEYRQEKLALAAQGRNTSFGILKFGFTTVLRKLIFA